MRDQPSVIDIENATPREAALQEALRQSEARYRQLVETASEGIWCIDTEGRTVSANQRMAQMLGYSIDELRTKTIFDLCSENDRAIARTKLSHRLGGNYSQHDWCFKRKDGEDIWCIICASPTFDADGQIIGAIGLVTDITARKHAEDRVRSLSRLYAMSSSVNEAIVRVTDQQSLYDHACRIAVERGELSFAWIAIRDSLGAPLNLIAYCGGTATFVKQVMGRINSTPTHPGPAGRALRDGVYAISNDIANDPSFFFKDSALTMSMQSCAVLPMKLADQVQGIFAVYSKQKDYFGDEEIRVLSALADDISFAVESAAKQLALQESERMMATLFSNLPGMSYRCRNDAEWTMDVVSPGCLALTGYAPENLIGNRDISFETVTHPLDRDMVRVQIHTGLNERRPFEVLYRIVTAQDAIKWVLERGTGVFDDNGELRFIEGFITDVTARREAEEQVTQQAALLDKATDAIVVYGLDDRVYYWNRGAENLYGWSATEVIGEKITTLTCRDTPERRKVIDALLVAGERIGELTQRTKDGREVIVDSSWTLVRDDAAKPHSILTINTDITQRKKLEAQFLTTQRLESIGTLAGGIAHDFNNILTAITGNTKLAASDIAADHPIQTHLHEIEKAGLRATELVRQILTFSRKQEPLRKALKLEDVVVEALRLLRATLPAQIEIQTRFEAVPDIAADATQIHQVMINLGTNAAHAMIERGGELLVQIDSIAVDATSGDENESSNLAPGLYVRIRVSDTGTGMDDVTRERIFEPFFTTKAQGQGTGLGLSVVHGIVRSHEGSISVATELGRGSTFSILFPPTTEALVVPDVVRKQTNGDGQHILYVDDEEALVFLTTRVLQRLGYRVTGRTDAKQALSEFQADPMQFDAVVSDLSMPGMTGPELARAMLAVRADVPIVLTSGYVRDEDLKIVRELKIRDLVLKPNTVEDLGATLHRLLTKETSEGVS